MIPLQLGLQFFRYRESSGDRQARMTRMLGNDYEKSCEIFEALKTLWTFREDYVEKETKQKVAMSMVKR